MEKKIRLVMNPNKDIIVFLNDEEKITIRNDNRSIEANDIYHLLDYSDGDSYIVEKENENEIDKMVLEFFASLFQSIVDKLSPENQDLN